MCIRRPTRQEKCHRTPPEHVTLVVQVRLNACFVSLSVVLSRPNGVRKNMCAIAPKALLEREAHELLRRLPLRANHHTPQTNDLCLRQKLVECFIPGTVV